MLDIEDRNKNCKIVDDYVKYYYPLNSFKWLSPLCQEPSALHVIASINYAARYRILTVDSEDSNWGEICVCVVADLIDCHHEWVSSVNTRDDTSPHFQQPGGRLHSGLDGPLTGSGSTGDPASDYIQVLMVPSPTGSRSTGDPALAPCHYQSVRYGRHHISHLLGSGLQLMNFYNDTANYTNTNWYVIYNTQSHLAPTSWKRFHTLTVNHEIMIHEANSPSILSHTIR